MFNQKKKRDFIESVIQRSSVISSSDKKQGLEFLISFFSSIRPQKGKKDPTENLQLAIRALHEHPILLTNLQHAFISQLINTDLSLAFTQSGIPLAGGFWQEFFGRVRHKLLPSLQHENDFLYVLSRVFFKKEDYQWVEEISFENWILFFEKVGLSFHIDDEGLFHQLIGSLNLLAVQVAQLGLEKDIVGYLEEEDQENNPFTGQIFLIHDLEKALVNSIDRDKLESIVPAVEARIQRCYRSLEFIRENHSLHGTSLHQTYSLVLLLNKLDRMTILVDALDFDHHFDTGKFVDFFRTLVRNENRKNSLREFLSQCLGYLAYQIAEHKGSKGNKYITTTRAEYRSMLESAMSGGAIVSFVAVIKNLITRIEMPIFWHGFLYSVNYSLGFIVIEETHATLATKQPAFTASSLASSLDSKKNTQQPNLYSLAVTVAKVSRSQIASFIGNLLIVFPGTFLLAWVYNIITGTKIAEGKAALQLLENQHPWHSPALLYAANTGFFLFLSGIIAGYVQNKMKYAHIADRLKKHPWLSFSFSETRLHRIANYLERNAGSLAGNISLGFMLGMAGLVVSIFGIPFDIRHITISAGNVAIGVYGLGFHHISSWYLATVILGVIGIGFVNFIVSFSLAFIVAAKSRGVRLRDYPEFLGILWRYLCRKPLNFIRPPSQAAEAA